MVQLSLSGEGLSVNEEISRLQALQILAFVDASKFSPLAPTSSSVLQPGKFLPNVITSKQESIGEYLRDSGAKTNAEKILALADYYCLSSAEESFSSGDIQRMFEKAREPMPKNFSRDFSNVCDAQWFTELLDEKGRYQITTTGKQVLSEKFEGAGPTSKRTSTSTLSKRQSLPEPVLSSEAIERAHTLFYSGPLQTEAEKILFIMAQAKKEGLPELKSQQINGIAVQLNRKPFSDVSTLLSTHKDKWMKSNGAYKIIENGVKFIEEKMLTLAA